VTQATADDAGIFARGTLGHIVSGPLRWAIRWELAGGVFADYANRDGTCLFSLCRAVVAVTNLLMLGSHSAWAWVRALVSQRLGQGSGASALRRPQFQTVQA